jgi:hypothetical protein
MNLQEETENIKNSSQSLPFPKAPPQNTGVNKKLDINLCNVCVWVAIDTPALQIASYNSPHFFIKASAQTIGMDHHPLPQT